MPQIITGQANNEGTIDLLLGKVFCAEDKRRSLLVYAPIGFDAHAIKKPVEVDETPIPLPDTTTKQTLSIKMNAPRLHGMPETWKVLANNPCVEIGQAELDTKGLFTLNFVDPWRQFPNARAIGVTLQGDYGWDKIATNEIELRRVVDPAQNWQADKKYLIYGGKPDVVISHAPPVYISKVELDGQPLPNASIQNIGSSTKISLNLSENMAKPNCTLKAYQTDKVYSDLSFPVVAPPPVVREIRAAEGSDSAIVDGSNLGVIRSMHLESGRINSSFKPDGSPVVHDSDEELTMVATDHHRLGSGDNWQAALTLDDPIQPVRDLPRVIPNRDLPSITVEKLDYSAGVPQIAVSRLPFKDPLQKVVFTSDEITVPLTSSGSPFDSKDVVEVAIGPHFASPENGLGSNVEESTIVSSSDFPSPVKLSVNPNSPNEATIQLQISSHSWQDKTGDFYFRLDRGGPTLPWMSLDLHLAQFPELTEIRDPGADKNLMLVGSNLAPIDLVVRRYKEKSADTRVGTEPGTQIEIPREAVDGTIITLILKGHPGVELKARPRVIPVK